MTEARDVRHADCSYRVSGDHTIQDPGKFQHESVEALYWYDAIMNGFGDLIESDEFGGGSVTGFDITDEDRESIRGLFGVELDSKAKRAIITETSDGFCYLTYE